MAATEAIEIKNIHKNRAKKLVKEVLPDTEPKDGIYLMVLQDVLAQFYAVQDALHADGLVSEEGEPHPGLQTMQQVRTHLLAFLKEASLTPSRTQKAAKHVEANPFADILGK